KKGVSKEDPKKKLPAGILSGKKDTAKTAITPRNLPNLPGKGLPGNLTGKTQTGNLPGANQPGKNLLGKATDTKGTVLGKGIDPKTAFSGPMRAATPVLRLQLRADHRRELLSVRRLLPVRLLPGERGFTAVPPVNETRLVSSEMVFRVGPNVSPQALQAAM